MLGTILIVILVLMLWAGHVAHLASQPKLGLWPERRAGIDCGHPARPAAHGTPVISQMPESEGEDNMRTLVFVVVLLLVGIVGVGFYRGWFQLSTDTTDQKPSATITVDKDKIHADEQKAKEKCKASDKRPRRKSATGPARSKNRNADPETTLRS